jgi:hypothetical protein
MNVSDETDTAIWVVIGAASLSKKSCPIKRTYECIKGVTDVTWPHVTQNTLSCNSN